MTPCFRSFLLTLLFIACAPAQAATPGCAPNTDCVETRSFTATVSGFRSSKQGSKRLLTATVRFVNKTSKPLTLGYVAQSGVALDNLGNRYEVPATGAVRAMGEISGTNFDPKFTLPAGEGSDARFELSWEPGKAKAGADFEMDLAIREITPTTGDQFKLGAEHALHFASLGSQANPAQPVAAAAPAAQDPCGGSPRCYNAGAFIAEVVQVQANAMTAGVRHHSVAFNIRFKNISDQPVILAYRSASSAGLDNFGNGFTWGRPGTHDTSVKGIGMVTGRTADTQFQLEPGKSRSATFNLIRFNAAPPIGERWNYDVIIEEIEIQPGQVVKSVRQNSLNFTNLAPGTFTASAGPGTVDAEGVAGRMIDLLREKARKK